MAASNENTSNSATVDSDSAASTRCSAYDDEKANFSFVGSDTCRNMSSASFQPDVGRFTGDSGGRNFAAVRCDLTGDGASGCYSVGTAPVVVSRAVAGPTFSPMGSSAIQPSIPVDDPSLSMYGIGGNSSTCTGSPASGCVTASAPSSKTASNTARCSVCGDEASGFHYGVDSCEGCKGFFRRCIIQGLTQQCANSEKCEITPLTRNSCQFCRLKKCFAVGMSRGASRLGRRPKRLKAQYSAEPKSPLPVKPISIAPQPVFAGKLPLTMAELEALLEKLNSQNRYNIKLPSLLSALNSLLQDGGPTSAIDDCLSDSSALNRSGSADVPRLTTNSRQLSPDTTGSETGLSTVNDVGPLSNGITMACKIKAEPGLDNGSAFHNGSAPDHRPLASPHIVNTCDARALVGTVYHQLREAEQRRKMLGDHPKPAAATMSPVNVVIDVSTPAIPEPSAGPSNADDAAVRHALAELVEDARRLPAAGSERANLVSQVIRSVIEAHMSTCHYTKEKVQLGFARYAQAQQWHAGAGTAMIDEQIDPLKVWQAFVTNMAPVIQRVVTFSKSLPGFSELCQDDQIKLIKQGSFEVILARYVPLFTDKGMFVPDMSIRVPLYVIQQMPLGDFFCEQYKFANSVNELELNDGELGVLTAIMIINPDRMGISNRRAVYKLRGLLLQSLYVYMKSLRPDAFEEKFMRTVDILVLSDRINKMHSCALNNMKMSSPNFQFPELHMEVYDGLP